MPIDAYKIATVVLSVTIFKIVKNCRKTNNHIYYQGKLIANVTGNVRKSSTLENKKKNSNSFKPLDSGVEIVVRVKIEMKNVNPVKKLKKKDSIADTIFQMLKIDNLKIASCR